MSEKANKGIDMLIYVLCARLLLKLFYILISVSCIKLNSKLDISPFSYHNVERRIVKIMPDVM